MVDGYVVGPPVIAVEVASPSNTGPALDVKTLAYLQGGVAEVWVVYAETASILVHRRESVGRYKDAYHCDLLNLDVPVGQLLKRNPSTEPQGR